MNEEILKKLAQISHEKFGYDIDVEKWKVVDEMSRIMERLNKPIEQMTILEILELQKPWRDHLMKTGTIPADKPVNIAIANKSPKEEN